MATTSKIDPESASDAERVGHPTESSLRLFRWADGAPPSDAERLSTAIMRLMWFNSKRLAQILTVYDLTVPQFYALMSISHGDGCRMGDLAHRLFQSSATMTGI